MLWKGDFSPCLLPIKTTNFSATRSSIPNDTQPKLSTGKECYRPVPVQIQDQVHDYNLVHREDHQFLCTPAAQYYSALLLPPRILAYKCSSLLPPSSTSPSFGLCHRILAKKALENSSQWYFNQPIVRRRPQFASAVTMPTSRLAATVISCQSTRLGTN